MNEPQLSAEMRKHCMCERCKDGVIHAACCAVHNMPAEPNGECDCEPETPAFSEDLSYYWQRILGEDWTNNQPLYELYLWVVKELATALEEQRQQFAVTENTSDGYHTFKELYEFRMLYNAGLFNEWAKQGKYNVHKSTRHHDGQACFGGGWFIVMATLPTGQISNHYEMKYWDLFDCDQFVYAEEWDGHTAKDVVERLEALLNEKDTNAE